ncbi:hypothetical protein MRX96_043452 [Rhipicephalus microplus]
MGYRATSKTCREHFDACFLRWRLAEVLVDELWMGRNSGVFRLGKRVGLGFLRMALLSCIEYFFLLIQIKRRGMKLCACDCVFHGGSRLAERAFRWTTLPALGLVRLVTALHSARPNKTDWRSVKAETLTGCPIDETVHFSTEFQVQNWYRTLTEVIEVGTHARHVCMFDL